MEEPGRLQSMGSLESDTTERLQFNFSLSCNGEGNGNPLQCSCLENPRDGEAWWDCTESDTTEVTQQQQETQRFIHALKQMRFPIVFSLQCKLHDLQSS